MNWRLPDIHQTGVRYGVALAFTGIATLIIFAIEERVGHLPPFITFYPALILSGLLGGIGPGLLATGVGAVIALFFLMSPKGSLSVEDLQEFAALLLFLFNGTLISVTAGWMLAAKNEARANEEKFRTLVNLVDHSSDALLIVDLHTGRIIFANEKLCQNLGYRREELLAMRLNDTSTWLSGLFGGHFEELRKIGSFLTEDMHRRKDGTTFPVEVSVKYIKANEREFAVAVIRDITERKRLEQEKAQKLESLGLLAGGIAHDFNNLLTAILGNIELAQIVLPPGSSAMPRLSVAGQACERAKGLSQQLLTFAKGGAPIKRVHSVSDIIREAAELALRGSNVKSAYSIPADLKPAEVDDTQLSQVVNNLVINADQEMPHGGILEITASNVFLKQGNAQGLKRGRYIKVDFKDQGSGIAPESLDKIFDPYFTTKKKGSGLGLAISFSIIRRHGGTITADSEVGKGSTFSIFLPVSKKRIGARKAEGPEEPVSGTGRVLVMDDEEDVREVAAEMLQHLGYRVETRGDGAKAIAAYQQALAAGDPFAAVITDLTVPAGMGGKETIRHLLEIDPQAKVIVSSGYGNDPIMSDYSSHGFKGVITKPYRLKELSKTIHAVIGKKRG